MSNNYGLHIRKFNERVGTMTQTRAQNLILSPAEAASLQSDIFALLSHVAELSQQLHGQGEASVEVVMDGGGFK